MTDAFHKAFLWAFLLALLALPPAFRLTRQERRANRLERLRGASAAQAEQLARLEPMR